MKIIQSSVFRSICAIVIGVLLIKYRDQAVTGMTIAIGILFFISGLISRIAYFSAKKKALATPMTCTMPTAVSSSTPRPPFPSWASAVCCWVPFWP